MRSKQNQLYVYPHLSISSQHVGRPTPSPKRVRFSPVIIVPKLKPSAAIRVYKKLVDSYTAAEIALGVLDSAAIGHFLPKDYRFFDHQGTSNGVGVGCANGSITRAVATDKLRLEALPDSARECHKFADKTPLPPPLVGTRTLRQGYGYPFHHNVRNSY